MKTEVVELFEDEDDVSLINYLIKKGIRKEEVETYLNPTKEKCCISPYAYPNMRDGINLLKYHILNESTIYIIQDGDTDGVLSTADLFNYLVRLVKHLGLKLRVKILIHNGKQRGLADEKLFNQILQEKRDLVIIPDAGTNDEEYAKILSENGIDLLVIDHHEPEDSMVVHGIVINNKLIDTEKYSDKGSYGSGCVVVWKVLQALDAEFGVKFADDYIDLSALSVISDSMDVRGLENRYLLNHLFKDKYTNNQFFDYLFDAHLRDDYTQKDISFKIIPKLNSVCRSTDYEMKENILKGILGGKDYIDTCKKCEQFHADQIEFVNAFVDKYKTEVSPNDVITILASDELKSSYSGLIAGKLSGLFNRPFIVGKIKNGELLGSFRGNGITRSELEQFDGVNWCKGHPIGAWGISLDASKLDKLQTELNTLTISYTPQIEVLKSYKANCLPKELFFDFAPFNELWGKNLPTPMFEVKDLVINTKDIQLIGAKKNVLKFKYNGIEFILFQTNEESRALFKVEKDKVTYNTINCTLIGQLAINEWRGKKTPQFIISEYDVKDGELDIFGDY